jgi:hypothetical protein
MCYNVSEVKNKTDFKTNKILGGKLWTVMYGMELPRKEVAMM